MSNCVVEKLQKKYDETNIPTVEEIQDAVEETLIELGHAKVAKTYILYRQKRQEEREAKKAILQGKIDEETDLSLNSLTILEKRYLLRNEQGEISETPSQMFWRVATNVAQAEQYYGMEVGATAKKFYDMMRKVEFLPNSPALMNAGTREQQLAACFVLPIDDSIRSIFETLKQAALIHRTGGGTGFSFSRLRPKNSLVSSGKGPSVGPVAFMKLFDTATGIMKQGGTRRGANMGILRVDHPDILEFVNLKTDGKTMLNFNISVAITDKFMAAVKDNTPYEIIDPKTSQVVDHYSARSVFDNILTMAWSKGDPGLVFIDRMNAANPCSHITKIEATNPCGEQALMPFESCNLGSINLNKCTKSGEVDWQKLKEVVWLGVRFLDDVIDVNHYPLPEIAQMSRGTRKIGLGIMGFADLLYQLNIKYNSKEGLAIGEKIMAFISDEARKASMQLAQERGVFPFWKGSTYEKEGIQIRNSTLTTIAPTGSIGLIADASGGLEPNFAIAHLRRVMGGTELLYANQHFEKVMKEQGLYSEELMREVAMKGSIQTISQIPEEIRQVFVTALDIPPEWHVLMQATFQKHVDSCISKTINFPANATIEDVEAAFMAAWHLGCKGVTIYRDRSIDNQVLDVQTDRKVLAARDENKKKEEQCPDCGTAMRIAEGCALCLNCGHATCF